MILTTQQQHAVSQALRIAANTYRKEAAYAREAGYERIAEQFDRQHLEAVALANLIDESEES